MADNLRRKCLKCGRSPKEDPDIKLYRFPNPGPTNILRSEMWAKFCFPDKEWNCRDFQLKLYAEHRMLCNKHFKESAYINIDKKSLHRFAVPDVECCEEAPVPTDNTIVPIPGPSRILKDITNIKSVAKELPVPTDHTIDPIRGPSCILMDITNIKSVAKQVPVPVPTRHIIDPIPGPSRPLDITKLNVKQVTEQVPVPVPTRHIIDPIPGPSRPLDITKLNVKQVTGHKMPSNNSGQGKSRKEKALYKKCRLYVKRISKLRNTIKTKNKLKKLNELHENSSYQKLIKQLTPSFAILLQSQLKNVQRKTKGRRWTFEEKIIALRLYKRSPMCYRLLRSMWTLPTPATLKSLLRQFNLAVGINDKILNALKDHVKRLQPSDNEYVLLFDEMSLRKHLEYKSKLDIIEGYQDHGAQHGRSEQEATHALVFMVAGIRRKEKQPIAYYLSSSYVTADRLAVLIKEVLLACFNSGLKIAATVCDMDGVNRRALTILGATKEEPYFTIVNNQVVAIFDPPHLLKCLRNLFLKYNIKCSTNIVSNNQIGQGLAKWSHIKEFYDLDNQNQNFVFAPALRKEHLNPNNKEKMRVKLAAQVFSHSVAAGMFAKVATGELQSDALATAELLSTIDKLFDSLNSERPDLRRGKPFARNMSKTSPHLELFNKMKSFFTNMELVGCARTPPSQQGWIWSLNAIERLWKNLIFKHKNIKSLATRRLQQDPLENLFGCIRASCGANTNPTVGQFVAALKTAIMSNLAHMSRGNCEQDENDCMLNNFKKIFTPTHIRPAENAEEQIAQASGSLVADSVDERLLELSSTESAELQACAYVCGFLLKRQNNMCPTCAVFLRCKEDNEEVHNFLHFKEYNEFKKSLNYASEDLVNCVEACATVINNLLRTKSHTADIKKYIVHECEKKVDFKFIKCHFDENVNFILNSVFVICVKRHCELKNREYRDNAAQLRKKINILKHV